MGAIRIWTHEEEKYLAENYATRPYQEIADALDRSELAVRLRRIALKLPPKLPRLPVNEHYFDTIDSDLKAYLLGFIAADGWVDRRTGNNSYLTLGLQIKDRSVVELLRDKLAPEKKLYETEKMLRLDVRLSDHFFKVFTASYNITVGRKPLYTIPPSISEQFVPTFLLGYFDGDGCLSYTKRGYWIWSFLGGLLLLNQVSDLIHFNLGFRVKPQSNRRVPGQHCLWLYSYRKISLVDNWLHRSGLGLERKTLAGHHG